MFSAQAMGLECHFLSESISKSEFPQHRFYLSGWSVFHWSKLSLDKDLSNKSYGSPEWHNPNRFQRRCDESGDSRVGAEVFGMLSCSKAVHRGGINDKTTTAHSHPSLQKAAFLRNPTKEEQQWSSRDHRHSTVTLTHLWALKPPPLSLRRQGWVCP